MYYRVSLSPRGEPHWWVEGALVPKEHTHIRQAHRDEAAIMDRICERGFSTADRDSLRYLLLKHTASEAS